MKPRDRIDLYMTIRNIRWRYKLDQFEDQALNEVLKSVDQARNEILGALDQIYGELTWTDERNFQLLTELDQLTAGIKSQLGEDVNEIASIAYEQSVAAHSSIMSVGGRAANVSMVQLGAEQIAAFLAEPVGGMHLEDWVSRTFDYPLQDKLKQELGAGLFRGESYRKLSRRIRGLMGEAADNADTLVRSWVQSANVKAQDRVAAENEDLMKGWKWSAVLENGDFSNGHGTCLRCLALDARDEVYPVNGGPTIPLHPNCRCIKRWITKSYRELGIPLDDLEDATRPYTVRGKVDPLTGEIRRGKTGTGGQPLLDAGRIDGGMDVFFRQLPQQLQQQTLGPWRYKLWKDGRIQLQDLADARGNQLTLAQLAKKKGLGPIGGGTPTPAFVPAKTIAEAQEWAIKRGIAGKVDYRKLASVDLANDINEQLDTLVKKYGVKYDKVTVGNRKSGNWRGTPAMNVAMLKGNQVTERQLFINQGYFDRFSGLEEINEKIAEVKKKGWWAAKDMKDIVSHEYGHNLTVQGVVLAKKQSRSFDIDYPPVKDREGLSRYAATDINESLAEIFVKNERGEALKIEYIELFNTFSEVKLK
jgi:hypothetical protein